MTFSAVMSMTTATIALALARYDASLPRNGEVPNKNVKAEKEKEDDLEIYLHLPQCIIMDGSKVKVDHQGDRGHAALRLKKSIYNLKQAGRLWA